ncbi:MAG: uridine phosphorylase [Deltaproteobacteria bacterium]|nr:uridine phosphorylase [Deltaproteobacteria bacterium]
MTDQYTHHLALGKEDIQGAEFAFLSGAPERVPKLTRAFDPQSKEIAYQREFRSWLGRIEGIPVLVTSTGIGGPSTSIAIEELAQLGVMTFIRVGTTGAIQREIEVGDVIITTGSVRMDGASTHYAPLEYPAVAHHEVLQTLIEAAQEVNPPGGFNYHIGITVSVDTFYPGQERYDTYSQYVIRGLQGSLEEWQRLHALNYEMESATVLTLCSTLGLRGGCVTGVLVNRTLAGETKRSQGERAEDNAIAVAVEAMRKLIRSSL